MSRPEPFRALVRSGLALPGLALAGLVLVGSALVGSVLAETADPTRLESLKHELSSSVERKKSLEAQSEKMRRETEEIRARLIDTAASVQARETEVSASEERLDALRAAEADLLARLDHRRGEMTSLLAALARLDRNPPPALAVRPDDALGAIRGAILLGAAVPELRAEADALKARLEELSRLRRSILAERETLAEARNSLERERTALEALLNKKLARQQTLAEAVESEQSRAERLSREATDLNDLIGKLEASAADRLPRRRPDPETRAAGREAAPETAPVPSSPAAAARPEMAAEASRPGETVVALAPPAGPIVSAMPSSRLFSQAKGLIRAPAAGPVVRAYGEPNGLGGHTQGLTIATRPEAQVTAPFDGRIVFAGPFRRYGQLLILAVGEGYHVLLAGMTKISGTVGQSILAGEPVGAMGPSASPGGSAADDRPAGQGGGSDRVGTSGERPTLYIEFRKDGEPIDPRPWLLMSDKKARG